MDAQSYFVESPRAAQYDGVPIHRCSGWRNTSIQTAKRFLTLGRIGMVVLTVGLARPPSLTADGTPPARTDRALIVVGLPGDDEHAALFKDIALAWRKWLTGPLQFPDTGVRVLFGDQGEPSLAAGPATRQAIADEVTAIQRTLAADGRLWVFFLGHTNVSGQHSFLHLPGPDLRDDELGALFKPLKSHEQVFWVTTPASGWFLPSLSTPGRIVITATTRDLEFNETEFPQALAAVSGKASTELDQDRDGKISVWEIFGRTSEAVEARFRADERAPTEHALLDDNGDKVGTERPDPARPNSPKEKPVKRESQDGELAKKTFLRLKIQ
jgi:hypothetical protein